MSDETEQPYRGYREGYYAARIDCKAASAEDFFHADSWRDGYHTALKDVRDGNVVLTESGHPDFS